MGELELDLVRHQATCSGERMELTSKEFDLLAYLARHAGKVCTHQMILGSVWGGRTEARPSTCACMSTGYAASWVTPA